MTLRLLAAPLAPGLASPLENKIKLVKLKQKILQNIQDSEGNSKKGANDDNRVNDVPKVTTVRARMKKDALIDHL